MPTRESRSFKTMSSGTVLWPAWHGLTCGTSGDSLRGNPHRNPPRTEGCREMAETPGQRRSAVRAMATLVESVVVDPVPVAHDQTRAAGAATGGSAFGVVHVAGIYVMQATGLRDAPRAPQGGRRRGRHVGELEVGVEGGEVQRHSRATVSGDPFAHRRDLGVRIVMPGN